MSRILAIVLLNIAFSFSLSAAPVKDPVHTWHHVFSNDSSNLLWQCQLGAAFETDYYFVNEQGQKIANFEVRYNQPFKFGFVFGQNVDFNLLYTLTCVRQDGLSAGSSKVAFVIGANGPAHPNIQVALFDGGIGTFTIVPNVGEDFYISTNNQPTLSVK